MATPQDLLGSPDAAAQAALAGPDSPSTDFSVVPPQPAAPQTSPTATPSYPASPDQPGGQNPIAGTSNDTSAAAPQKHSLWRSVVVGALSGIESHLAGMAKGALVGGIPGAIVGAASPKMADEALASQRSMRNSEVKQAEYRAQNAEEQAAMNHVNLLQLERDYARSPKSLQEQLDQQHEVALSNLYHSAIDNGNAQVVQSFGDFSDPNAWTALKTLQGSYMSNGVNEPFSYQPGRDDSGKLVLMKVRDLNAPIHDDINVDTGEKDADGEPVMFRIPGNTPWIQAQSQIQKIEQQRLTNAAKIHAANATGVTAKNQATANKSNAQAGAAANGGTGEWRPKVGADEKKKAELAENIAFNANEVSRILLKRPDLVGAIAGRVTNVEQAMGNNDPDISAIATHIHNMAMANSGVHGFRSQEGVESYEKQLLNNFRNGPRAVAGALRASVGSVQTFVDNARPDTYRTHSKNGGAIRGMIGGQ
jgi:hypothetical protein